jgi:hypothetical protein
MSFQMSLYILFAFLNLDWLELRYYLVTIIFRSALLVLVIIIVNPLSCFKRCHPTKRMGVVVSCHLDLCDKTPLKYYLAIIRYCPPFVITPSVLVSKLG